MKLALPVLILGLLASQRHGLPQAGPPSFQQTHNPDAAGLWIGEVTLREVNYAPTGEIAATSSTLQMQIILHVDGQGAVRLLKDAIVASRTPPGPADPPFPYKESIVTKPAALAALPIARDLYGSAKAQRFSTVAYDFTDNDTDKTDGALDLAGGLGQNLECVGTLILDKNHPTNPFRHKFHPDHANEGAKAYTITRSLKLQFIDSIRNIGGVTQLQGSYEEAITGLHNATLNARGTLRLTRVSTAGVLN